MNEPIIEVFCDEEEQSCACRLRTCNLPAEVYGIVLYDLARQIARMFAQHGGFDEASVLAVIMEYFDKERARPTSEVQVNRLND